MGHILSDVWEGEGGEFRSKAGPLAWLPPSLPYTQCACQHHVSSQEKTLICHVQLIGMAWTANTLLLNQLMPNGSFQCEMQPYA